MLEKYILKMFNRRASSERSRPDEILSCLDIRSGESIADIGSGGGYFAFRFAEEVGDKGHVYTVDVKAKRTLRPEGRVVIIDNKREKGFMSRLRHSPPKESIIHNLENAGYKLESSFDFLDQQWFMVFSVNN